MNVKAMDQRNYYGRQFFFKYYSVQGPSISQSFTLRTFSGMADFTARLNKKYQNDGVEKNLEN